MNIEEIIIKLGRNLKELRKDKGLSQDELAKISGVSRRVIGHLENGATNPPIDKIILLANVFNISIDEFIGFKPTKLVNTDISFNSLKKARVIDKLPTRSQNEIFKIIGEKAKKAGIDE